MSRRIESVIDATGSWTKLCVVNRPDLFREIGVFLTPPMKQRKNWNEKMVKVLCISWPHVQVHLTSNTRATQNFFKVGDRSCQFRRLRCCADLAARGAAPFVLIKFNHWRQRLNFTVPSCIFHHTISRINVSILSDLAALVRGEASRKGKVGWNLQYGDYNHARVWVSWITSTRGLLLRGYTGRIWLYAQGRHDLLPAFFFACHVSFGDLLFQ